MLIDIYKIHKLTFKINHKDQSYRFFKNKS